MTTTGSGLPEWDPALRDRVRRLMRVLRAIAAAKTRPMRHTDSCYGVQWLGKAAEHLTVQPATEPGHEVLRAPRVVSEPAPELPAELKGWVDHRPKHLVEPTLNEHGPARYGDVVGLDERPEQRERFGRWLRAWRAWAEAERVRRARAAVHDELFRMYRTAEDRPESVEIVLSGGLLHLPDPDTGGVHVHVVNQPVDLTRDVATGDMVVAITEAPARLEDDEILGDDNRIFDGSGGPRLRERLDELVSGAVDPELATFLKEWRDRALKVACELSDSWDEPSSRRAELRLAPAVVARPRSGFALRNYFDTIIASLEDESAPVPLGLAQLVEPLESDVRLAWLERSGKLSGGDLATDPLFPLPANPAQRQIIARMGGDSGVVVEGPPGTGKTHTIANLVSSLLAQGQRVLVTSEKAQALKVLRDKLPSEMQDLCISMTDASSRGDSDLARSVTRISTRKTSFEPVRAQRTVTGLAERRRALEAERERLLNEIQALREFETVVHAEVAPGFTGTTAAIARAVVATAEDGWIVDDVTPEPMLTVNEFYELLDLLRAEDASRRSRRDQVLPSLDSLPTPQRLAELAEALQRGDLAVAGDDGELVGAIENLPDPELHALDPASRRAADALTDLQRGPRDPRWAHAVAEEQLRGQRVHAWKRATDQLGAVDEAVAADTAAQNADVQVDYTTAPAPDSATLDAYAADVEANGTSFWPWMKSAEQKTVESYKGRLAVNGAVVDTAAIARMAAGHLRVLETAASLNRAFEPLGAAIRPTSYRTDLVDEMVVLARTCRAVAALLASRDELASLLVSLPASSRPRLDGVAAIHRLTTVAAAVAHARQGRVARHELSLGARQIDQGGVGRSPEHDELLDAWRDVDPARFARGLDAVARAQREQRAQERADALLGRFRSGAPRLADDLAADPHSPRWDSRVGRLHAAWSRARAVAWIDRHREPGRERAPEQELQVATHDLSQVTASLAAERAWKACLEGMSAREMQALQMYRQQMASIGKGTGKFAEKFRQGARAAMAEAQHAVPAWIMPIQQVLASVPPEKDVFDVVIVDEASQAELTSAFLLWLAPRMIVVGDDKQCTPAEVTLGALAPIFDRLDNELPDLPVHRRMQFTSKSSVFSLLRSCFPQVIRLQEHFRCMPEIIEWSSAEFYADAPLVPLRQFGADRLTPLRATYVPQATQHGTGQKIANLREAHVIADLVERCSEDPQYAGRTFGVVVLQGHGQVQLIEDVLRRRLGDDQWDRRRLRVGTPPDFQGDERHVVWLSMVLAPDHRSMALTNEMYRQRFNVAASRAQDQLWLVHSMPVDRLGAADMRRLLLEHMTAVDDAAITGMPEGVGRDDRVAGFDSLLEQNVFCDLAERGHHVTPQLEINGRRLDLVVTGPGGRVAVECDADSQLLGDEERRAELDREQELKRAAWRFSRVPASDYVLDRSAVMARLDDDLVRAGVTPLLVDGARPIPVRVVDEASASPAGEEDADDELAVDEPPPKPAGARPFGTGASDATPPPVAPPSCAEPVPDRVSAPAPGPSPDAAAGAPVGDARVLALFGVRESLTRDDVAAELGLTVGAARTHLVRLRHAGWLNEHGDRRNPWYSRVSPTADRERPEKPDEQPSSGDPASVPEEPAGPSTDGMSDDEVDDLIVRLVGERGSTTASDLASLIGVSRMDARGLLADLETGGRLAKGNERSGPLSTTFALPARTATPAPEVVRHPQPPQAKPAGRPGAFSRGPVASPSDATQADAQRRSRIRRIANEMRNLGAVEPAVDVEIRDDDPGRGGSILCIAELFWADGMRGDGAKAVVLELDPEEADLGRLRELRFRVFTSIDDLRSIMTAELRGSYHPARKPSG